MAKELVGYVAEHGDRVYIQAPVTTFSPTDIEIEQFAYATDLGRLKAAAPNPHILWLQGRYVEADNANANGDQWTAGELAIKSLTPMFMPVTVMHDMRTAVGTIADAGLRTPTDHQVPRSRIETALACWQHRFPEVCAEAKLNADQGTLMQSMECISPDYECGVCGALYPRLPNQAERAQWCAHLRGDDLAATDGRRAARILRSVVFTGTGLIFGTRGAKGAYGEAYLEVGAIAELFAKAHHDLDHRVPPRRTNVMDIDDRQYQDLVASKAKGEQAEARVTELTAENATLKTTVETTEATLSETQTKLTAAEAERDAAKETARVAALRDERMGKLGKGFKAKVETMPTTKATLTEQAGTLSDEQWAARLAELSETTGVKHDDDTDPTPADPAAAAAAAGGTPPTTPATPPADPAAAAAAQAQAAADAANPIFANEVLASSGVGTAAAPGDQPTMTPAARRSVVAGLVRPRTPAPAGAAK
jgi:hypothetical protein